MVAERTNYLNDDQKRLLESVRIGYRHNRKLEDQRKMLLKEVCGPYFDGDESQTDDYRERLLNLLYTTIITLRPLLSFVPQPKFGYRSNGLGVFARIFERATDQRFKECDVKGVIRDLVYNALFDHGIIVTGIAPEQGVDKFKEATGYLDDPGKMFMRCIDSPDFVYDTTARRWDMCEHMGHFQDVPMEFAMHCGLYLPEQIKLIPKLEKDTDNKKIDGCYDKIRLLHLYLPQTRELVTIPGDLDEVERIGVLSQRPYKGPEGGPYDRLSFIDAVGTVKPISLLAQMVLLAQKQNSLINKMVDRALNEKDHPTGNFSDKKVLEGLHDAEDMQPLMSDGGTINNIHVGGVSTQQLAGQQLLQELYNRASLNTDVLGGLAPQSKTLGQDQQLLDSAGIKITDFQALVVDVGRSLCKKTAYWLWHDEFADFTIQMSNENELDVFEEWNTDYREGEFDDYNLDISVFVGQNDTPEERSQRESRFVNETLLPLAPMAAQQGKTLNVDKIVERLGGYGGIDSPEDFWIDINQPEQPIQQQPAMSRGGDKTTINMGGSQSKTPLESASEGLEE